MKILKLFIKRRRINKDIKQTVGYWRSRALKAENQLDNKSEDHINVNL